MRASLPFAHQDCSGLCCGSDYRRVSSWRQLHWRSAPAVDGSWLETSEGALLESVGPGSGKYFIGGAVVMMATQKSNTYDAEDEEESGR